MQERFQQYYQLINQLLSCPEEEQLELLQANTNLLDLGLFITMERVASYYDENDNANTAQWLRSMAQGLVEAIGFNSIDTLYQEYFNCLMEILQAVKENPKAEFVYPVLQKNIEKLNLNLALVLQRWAQETLPTVELEQAQGIAAVIGNFGSLIQEFPWGSRSNNLELAIIANQVILTVFTQADSPDNWATTQNNLGIAYANKGGVENLDRAIECYKNALLERKRETYPYDWATTQNNLGAAYRNKGGVENLDRAIECYKNALLERQRETYPYDWAMTQNNLGNAYADKGGVENLDRAIECYKNALLERKRETYPYDWAMTQNNLGNAYVNKGNLDCAIKCYKNALLEWQQETSPYQWASTQNNLGLAYQDKGGVENLDRAIECYRLALLERKRETSPYDWATTQNNLGLAYQDKGGVENLARAIECYQNALTILTSEQFSFDCLKAIRNLGNLHFSQGNWALAISAYREALAAIEINRNLTTKDQNRQQILADSMVIYEKMLQACINNGQIDLAIETAERSRGRYLVDLMASNDLYKSGEIPPQVLEYLKRYEDLQERLHWLRSSAQSKDNRSLEAAGTRYRSSEIISAEREEIIQLEAEIQEIWQQLRSLDPILAAQKQVAPINFPQIQQLIDNNTTAILCCYSTSEDTYIFILYKDRPPQVHACGSQNIGTLHEEFLGNNWLIPYQSNFSQWLGNMPKVLEDLAQRLQLNQLITKYLQGIEELIIIPHLWLHQIPFAALPIKDSLSFPTPLFKGGSRGDQKGKERGDIRGMAGIPRQPERIIPENQQYLGDLFRLRVLPSCKILEYCHQRPQLNQSSTMGIVENASEDLPYTAYECETLANKYKIDPSKRLQGRQATVKECRQLADQVQILHFSHHASANPSNPLESALIFSDRNLPLGELINWRIPHLSDSFLNNCETNYSVNEITDDLLTIATALLCAGARSVVSTLWTVDDCASALLAIFYYDYRRAGLTRSQALQKAQKDLRTMTGEKLKNEYYQQLNQHLQNLYQQAITTAKNAQKQGDENYQKYQQTAAKISLQINITLPQHCQEKYPFASPFYWAGFISQGLA